MKSGRKRRSRAVMRWHRRTKRVAEVKRDPDQCALEGDSEGMRLAMTAIRILKEDYP